MIAVLALFTDIAFLRAPLHVRLPDLAVSHSILGAWVAQPCGDGPFGDCRSSHRAGVAVTTVTVLLAIVLFAGPDAPRHDTSPRGSSRCLGSDGATSRLKCATTNRACSKQPVDPPAALL
jgi:hypothetical protein